MPKRSRTGGGIGTNQYQIRGQGRHSGPIINFTVPVLNRPNFARSDLDITDDWYVDELVNRRSQPIDDYADATPAERARAPEEPVRYGVAKDPATPASILTWLSQDLEPWVRTGVAGNENTPIETLERLATDPDGEVREATASNRSTPISIRAVLQHDPIGEVRTAAIPK